MSRSAKILIISLSVNFLIWILLLAATTKSEPIILHYSAYLGADLIGFWHESFSLPLAGLFIIGLNSFLAWFLNETRLQYFLISASLMCQIFLLIGGISIIAING